MKKPASMASGLITAFVGIAWLVSAGTVQAQDVIKIAAGAPLPVRSPSRARKSPTRSSSRSRSGTQKGGVLGKKIEVMDADDQGNPQVGVAAAEKVAADPAVMGAIWGITSGHLHSGFRDPRPLNIVLITPGCTNPKVTDRGLKIGQPGVRARRLPGAGRRRVR